MSGGPAAYIPLYTFIQYSMYTFIHYSMCTFIHYSISTECPYNEFSASKIQTFIHTYIHKCTNAPALSYTIVCVALFSVFELNFWWGARGRCSLEKAAFFTNTYMHAYLHANVHAHIHATYMQHTCIHTYINSTSSGVPLYWIQR